MRKLTLPLQICALAVTLLVSSATAQAADRFVDTQLYSAAENGTGWLAKILLLVGADPNFKREDEGTTPLIGAAGAGQVEMVKLLLDKGADPKITDRNGGTALTAGYHHLPIVKLLIDKGADVNAQPTLNGRKSMTALMQATTDGDKDVVQYLLEHGADPTMKMASEKSAYDMAELRKFPEISKLLVDAIAKRGGPAPGTPGQPPGGVAAAPGTPPPGAPPAAAPGAPGATPPAAQAAAATPPAGAVPNTAAPAGTPPPAAAPAQPAPASVNQAAAPVPPAAAPPAAAAAAAPAAAPPAAAAPAATH